MSPKSRRDDMERLRDIAGAAIVDHLQVLEDGGIPERVIVDAIKYNLVAIGEAVAHVSDDLRAEYPDIDWMAIKGLRNILTHEYFKVKHQLIRKIAEEDVPVLAGPGRRDTQHVVSRSRSDDHDPGRRMRSAPPRKGLPQWRLIRAGYG